MRRAGSAVIFSLASLVLVAGVVAGPAAAVSA